MIRCGRGKVVIWGRYRIVVQNVALSGCGRRRSFASPERLAPLLLLLLELLDQTSIDSVES